MVLTLLLVCALELSCRYGKIQVMSSIVTCNFLDEAAHSQSVNQ